MCSLTVKKNDLGACYRIFSSLVMGHPSRDMFLQYVIPNHERPYDLHGIN